MKSKIATILLISPLLINCASMTSGTTQPMSVDTAPEKGAVCELSNDKGKWFITSTPGSALVNRAHGDMTIQCHKGEKNGMSIVPSSLKGVTFGNMVFGGLIGVAIDHSNGSAYEYPALTNITLK